MRKYYGLICLFLLILSCGGSNTQRKKNTEPYNLMGILALPDMEYFNQKKELIDNRGFMDGAEWAKRAGRESGENQMRIAADDHFKMLYGTPEGMTDNEMDQHIYEDFRDDYVRGFSKGCHSIW